ncbi:MAG TPA: CBS domain-containing protein [Nitrospira sp.]|nr:CBS domain-containing protein [Nitrospira sp.]
MATVGQLMTRDLSAVPGETTIQEAAAHMHGSHIGSLLVETGETFSGIITETDVVRAVAERIDVAGTAVSQLMSKPIVSVEKELSPHYARDLMADKHTRHLAVTDAGAIVGIISARDLLAYFKTVSQAAV